MKKLICLCLALVVLLPFNVSAVSTSAKAAILINGDTGEVIFEQNADERLPMASTTKIMTALLLCESGDLKREICVTAEMLRVEGSSMGLLAGDRITLRDLLYGLMLASGNDAANVVAFTLGGTINAFAGMMNKRAAELGLNNTGFVTPSGLDADGHYTTARDLANLARIAMQNKDFYAAASSKSATLNFGNPPYKRSLTNHNRLLKTFEGAVGIKTGFTKKSGRCLVSAAKRDGKYVIAITLNDPDDWKDHTELLEYGINAIKTNEIKPERSEYTIPVIGGKTDKLTVKVDSLTVSSLKDGEFGCEVNLPKFIYAPVEKGEKIGTAVYKMGNSVISEAELCADKAIKAEDVKKSALEYIIENLRYIFKNIWEK